MNPDGIYLSLADDLNENVRFIRICAINGMGQWIFTDEIFVDPVR